jgi:nucleoid DNA-binding protein
MPSDALTREEIAITVAKRLGITIDDAERVVRETLNVVRENIVGQRPIILKNFGTFKIVRHKARIARCPRPGCHTDTLFEIPEHNAVSFRVSRSLKAAVISKPLVR